MIAGYENGRLVKIKQWMDTIVTWEQHRAELKAAYEASKVNA